MSLRNEFRARAAQRPRLLAVALLAAACLPTPAGPRPELAAASALTGSIDWNDVHQVIDGFGASGAFGQAGQLQSMPEPQRTQVLDSLYSPTRGAGLSIVRNYLPNIEPYPGYYYLSGDSDQIWLMQQAAARGTTRFMGTAWSPPAWMKTNNSETGGGSVIPSMYPAYADYLAHYVNGYRANFGLTISDVSLANEPDASTFYASSNWTGDQFRDFLKQARPVWQSQGMPAHVILPADSYWSEDRALSTLADPVTAPMISTVAAHGYNGANDPTPWRMPLSRAAGKHIWQTEMSEFGPEDASITNGLHWARIVHNYLTQAEVNAYNYWWAVTTKTDDEALVNLVNPAAGTYTLNKRLFTLGNYSRFIRPGWVRIGTPLQFSPNPGALVSAYRDPVSGQFAVVAVNDGATAQSVRLRLNGFSAASVIPYTTSATQNLAAGSALSTSSGSITINLAANTVTTLVGSGRATSPFRVTGSAVVASANGQSSSATFTVTNVSASPAGGRLVVSAPLAVSPRAVTLPQLAGGAFTTVSFTVTVAPGTAPADYTVEATAASAGGGSSFGDASVRVLGPTLLFVPHTAAERDWMVDTGFSHLDGAVDNGNARFTDGSAYVIYLLAVPPDVTGGALWLDIGNQFQVRTSTDGINYVDRLVETRQIRDNSNRGWRAIDLNAIRGNSQFFALRIQDSFPGDGWGAWIAHIALDLRR